MKWGIMTAAAAATAFAAAAPASALVIDSFTTPQRVSDVSAVTSSEVFAPEALGNYREMRVSNFGGVTEGTSLAVTGGLLNFSNNAGTTGEGFIIYDGMNSAGLGGVNFLIGPNPFLQFDVVDTDIAGLFIQITARDTSGLNAVYSETLPSVEDLETRLFLTEFTTDGGFDFGSLDYLEFYVRSDAASLDGILNEVTLQAVPVPAAAFLLVGAVGGLGALRLRRKS